MSATHMPQPSLEAKLSPAEMMSLRRDVMCAMTNAQDRWMDGVLKKIMPKKLYRMVSDQSGPWSEFVKRQTMIGEWLDKQDIRVIQRGVRIQQMYRGTELLSTFVLKLADK